MHYRAVVIGGGIVGASVLYHLAKLGWKECLLLERGQLTAGSTWHAAGGFHALNADPNVAALQAYTVGLYGRLEADEPGCCGLHLTGGLNLAGSEERLEWLRAAWAVFQTVGITTARLVGRDEIAELCPLLDVSGIHGGLYDANEGHLDPSGTTNALARAARRLGADVSVNNRVVELRVLPEGGWSVVAEHGTVTADHVVNAGGLWARRVGRMAGVDLPVTPMQHHYLVSEPIAELVSLGRELPVTVDLEGFTYLRQEGEGVLLGVYERCPEHWHAEGAPWGYGTELLPVDVDRIAPELEIGLARYPSIASAGIKRWVNGPFTFTPDGNPLIGPVRGLPGFWVACGVMAGFSQGGGVGKSLAEWMVEGEPEADVFGMDVARYGAFASADGYLEQSTSQFYRRRFVMSYPNEQLPAGRPLTTSAVHDELEARGARWGVSWDLEIPLYFVPDPADRAFSEAPTLKRSNAFDFVGREVGAARSGVGVLDLSGFARYRVAGPGAGAFLDRLVASRLPEPGQVRLAPMLSPSGRLMGDLTLTCWQEDEYWVIGSYYLREWHMRWFVEHLPRTGVVVDDISSSWAGVAVIGPRSTELLAGLVSRVGETPFLHAREVDVGLLRSRLLRISITGETGYELYVESGRLRSLYRHLQAATGGLGACDIGYRSVDSMRLEKSYGIWSREFSRRYTPGMSRLDRFIDYEKADFVGRDACLKERETGPSQQLVTLQVEAADADAGIFEPVWQGERRVGFVTSGGYGHRLAMSLALAYVERPVAEVGTPLEVHVVGVRRSASVIPDSPYDPAGARMRA